jgi:Mn-dependent DtxR family transcriptional regulator
MNILLNNCSFVLLDIYRLLEMNKEVNLVTVAKNLSTRQVLSYGACRNILFRLAEKGYVEIEKTKKHLMIGETELGKETVCNLRRLHIEDEVIEHEVY